MGLRPLRVCSTSMTVDLFVFRVFRARYLGLRFPGTVTGMSGFSMATRAFFRCGPMAWFNSFRHFHQ